jgi:hypothetical protein
MYQPFILDQREDVDVAPGIRRFEAVDVTGATLFEGVEFSNGRVAITNDKGSVAVHDSLKSMAGIDDSVRLMWVGDATSAEQQEQRDNAYAAGRTDGEMASERSAGEMEIALSNILQFIFDEVDTQTEDIFFQTPLEVSGYVNREIDKLVCRLTSEERDANDLRVQVDRLLKRNGELLAHVRIARHVITDLTSPQENLSAYLEARKLGAQFLKDSPK